MDVFFFWLEERKKKEKLFSSFRIVRCFNWFSFFFLHKIISSLFINTGNPFHVNHTSFSFCRIYPDWQIVKKKCSHLPKGILLNFSRFVYTWNFVCRRKTKLAKKNFFRLDIPLSISYTPTPAVNTHTQHRCFPRTCMHYSRGHFTNYCTRRRHLLKAYATINDTDSTEALLW